MQFNEKRHQEAATVFIDPKSKIKVRPTWKGSHNGCEHHTGVCKARDGWQLTVDGSIRPIIINLNVEKRALTMVEYADDSGMGAEPLWRSKGWKLPEEAKGVKPSREVVDYLLERGLKEVRTNAEHSGAKLKEINEAVEEYRAKYSALAAPADEPKVGRGRA